MTIEVRFITLSDNFFERIGVDFDFNIDDNTNLDNFIDQLPTAPAERDSPNVFDDSNPASVAIGWTATGPTADLDLPVHAKAASARRRRSSAASTPTRPPTSASRS